MINNINVIILAGAKNDGRLKDCASAEHEALISIGGKTMVEHVVAALQGTGRVKRIVIVGPAEELAPYFEGESEKISIAPCGASIDENVSKGLAVLEGKGWVLAASSDIPLLTPEAVNDFLDRCKGGADFFYPIVTKESVVKAFGDMKRTYIKVCDGTFTGGNIFLFKSEIAAPCLEKGRELINLRKSPFKLAKVLGIGFLLKFLTGSLKISEAERVVSKLLGSQGRAVISEFSEIGVDVDKPADLLAIYAKIKSL